MKFTEEQFKKLVKIQEKYFSHNMLEKGLGGASPCQAINESDIEMSYFIWAEYLKNEDVAIMNPATRDWAHERFVEKENKYVWRLKADDSMVVSKEHDSWYLDRIPTDNMYFSEKEINNSPFKPEWFDKEEVE